jgi:hypothetical protein
MKIEFEDKEYQLDLDDITVAQAKVIKVHRQLTLKSLSDGLNELDPDALVATYWLMRIQSGDTGVDIDRVDFMALRFAEALAKGAEAENDVKAEDETPKG